MTCRWPTGWASEERVDGGSVASGCSPQCLDMARLSWCHTGWAQDSRPAGWDHTAAPHRVDLQFNNIKETYAWICLKMISSLSQSKNLDNSFLNEMNRTMKEFVLLYFTDAVLLLLFVPCTYFLLSWLQPSHKQNFPGFCEQHVAISTVLFIVSVGSIISTCTWSNLMVSFLLDKQRWSCVLTLYNRWSYPQ